MTSSILRFLVILLFPSICYADGTSIQTWTLSASSFSFLVNIISIDKQNFKAKVKIHKKYRSPFTLDDQSPAVYPAKSFDSTERNQSFSESTIPWEKISDKEEYTIFFKRPVKPEPGKWVIDEAYWDEADHPKKDDKMFIVHHQINFIWVNYSPKIEQKFDYFFDIQLRNQFIKKATLKELALWVTDLDLRPFALEELKKRKALGPEFFFSPELENHFVWILRDLVEKENESDQKQFITPYLNYIKKNKLRDETLAEFLKLFNYLPQGLLSFKEELEIASHLKYQKVLNTNLFTPNKVNQAIESLHRKIKDQIYAKLAFDFTLVFDQILDGILYGVSPVIDSEYVYKNTNDKERKIFYQMQSKILLSLGFSHEKSSSFSAIAFQLRSDPDLKSAQYLMQLDLNKAPANIKIAILEAVFESFMKEADMNDKSTRKKLIDFMDQFIDKKIPTFLEASIIDRLNDLKNK